MLFKIGNFKFLSFRPYNFRYVLEMLSENKREGLLLDTTDSVGMGSYNNYHTLKVLHK